MHHALLSGEEAVSGQEVGHDELSPHRLAVRNVKKFFWTFIVFDLIVVVTYGYHTWTDMDENGSRSWSLGQILEGAVALVFTCDVVLASALLYSQAHVNQDSVPTSLWEDHYELWEGNYQLIQLNWASNITSLLVMAWQRFFASYEDHSLIVGAVLYLVMRAVKLRPLGELRLEVARACSHPGEPDRYEGLLAVWAAKQDERMEKLMTRVTLISVAITVITLGIAGLYDLVLMGTSASQLPLADSILVPTSLGGVVANISQPLSRGPHPMLFGVDPFSVAAGTAAACAGTGATIGTAFGPEAIPVGGAVGAAFCGTGSVIWELFHSA